MGLRAASTIKFVQDWHLKLWVQSYVWEKRERLIIHEVFHLTCPFDYLLLYLTYLLINLLLTLRDRGSLITLFHLALQVLKGKMNLTCDHSV